MSRIKIIILILGVGLLAACAPSPQVIQTAIAETQAAWEPNITSTLIPISISTSTSMPTPVPVVLYSDDFSNIQSGWDQSDSQGIRWMYSGGQYVLSDAWGWLHNCAQRNLTDAVLTVDVIHVSGDAGLTGAIINWRYHDDIGYYSLRLFGDGYLTIEKVSMTGAGYQKLNDRIFNAAINTNQNINHIAISFKGENSTIYINGKYVTSIKDSSFTTGDFCLGAFASKTSPVEVSFDNLVVYTIDSWTPPE
jgi:hypothetical protein